MKKVLLFVLIALVGFSCEKDPIQYTFEGTITEDQAGSALSGAEVTIYQKPFNNSLTTDNFVIGGTSISDASGNYSITFDREKITEFKINITKDNYFKKDIILNSGEISSENINVHDYEMEAESWVKFNISNSFPSNAADELQLLLSNYREGCEECAEYDSYSFPGITDTSVKFASTAGKYFNFVAISLGESSIFDSVYMTPFDTSFYSINY